MVATGYVKWVLSSTSGHQANWWHPLTLLMYLELYRGRNMLSCPLKAIIASLAEQFWRRGFSSWHPFTTALGTGQTLNNLLWLCWPCGIGFSLLFRWMYCVLHLQDQNLDSTCPMDEWFSKKKVFFLPWLCRNNPGTRNFIMKVSAVKRSLKRWELNWTVNRSGNFLSLEGRGV